MTSPQPLRIVFARHGSYTGKDLNGHGVRQSHELGTELQQTGLFGDQSPLIVVSPEPRAQQAAQIVQTHIGGQLLTKEQLNVAHEINPREILTFNETRGMGRHLQLLNDLPDEHRRVVAVTHQPNVIALSALFGRSRGHYYNPEQETAAVGFEIDAPSWSQMRPEYLDNARVIFERHGKRQDFFSPQFVARHSVPPPRPVPRNLDFDDDIPF